MTTQQVNQCVQGLCERRNMLIDRFQTVLYKGRFTNHPTIDTEQRTAIAVSEVDNIISFVAHADPSMATCRGKQLSCDGVSFNCILNLGRAARQFCIEEMPQDLQTFVWRAVEDYYSSVLLGAIKGGRLLLLKGQEQVHSAMVTETARLKTAIISDITTELRRSNQLTETWRERADRYGAILKRVMGTMVNDLIGDEHLGDMVQALEPKEDDLLGVWLLREITDRGLSPSEFARKANLPPTVINRIVSGVEKPAQETLEKIALALNLSIGELLVEAKVNLGDDEEDEAWHRPAPARAEWASDLLEEETSFGAWLTGELARRGLNQSHLASLAGVSHATISRIVSGQQVPNAVTVAKIATALDLPIKMVQAKVQLGVNEDLFEGGGKRPKIEPGESSLGPWLQGEIDSRGWSQAQFAVKVGFSSTHVNRIIQGAHIPDRIGLKKIAQVLDVPLRTVLEQAATKREAGSEPDN